ncbi:MAG: mechanosensitive ion channel family protein [Phycisphaerae bacterium]|nr:mechanosensitive ion channel family protein [Phycisphaerae bacterium]
MIDHSLAPIVLATTSGGAAANSAASSSAKALEYLIIAGFDWGGRILGVVLIMFLAWVVATWARRSLYRFIQRARADATLASFAGNSVRWAILILGVVACLSIFGINIAAVTAVIGAAGLAVGLAMQGSLSNLAAGIMLLVLRPFRVGDGISVAGQTGRVDDIDLFHTKIDTADNRRLIVPNSAIIGATIENGSHHAKRRVDVNVRTVFGTPIEETRRVMLEAADSVPQRLHGEPVEVALVDLMHNGIQWQVRIWTATGEVGAAKDELVCRVKEALEARNVAFPMLP